MGVLHSLARQASNEIARQQPRSESQERYFIIFFCGSFFRSTSERTNHSLEMLKNVVRSGKEALGASGLASIAKRLGRRDALVAASYGA